MSVNPLRGSEPIGVTSGKPVPAAGSVVIQTHGCKLNQADSSILARQFRSAGYQVVEDVRKADIYVLNTCTVTSTADSKARQALRAARRANPGAIVVAAGCYPQRAAEELAGMPAVDLVLGNADKERVASLAVAAHQEVAGFSSSSTGDNYPWLDEEGAAGNLPGRTRAMVKIQEGCNQVCAYCIVPKVRGREKSVPPERIVRQVQRTVDEGYKEAVLTGTQLGSYGFDLPGTNLKALILRLLEETGIPRLRVSSLQPQEINEGLLGLWLTHDRLCPHFHIPLQSGSDPVLKAMRRRYTTSQFAKAVQVIRAMMPGAGVTTDLIVGFPGEGETEFEASLAFAAEMEFSDLHAFPYSPRPGTSAAYLGGRPDDQAKRERMAAVLEMARSSSQRFRKNLLGSTRPVLWEGQSGKDGGLRGLTDNYIRVWMEPPGAGGQSLDFSNKITLARLVEVCGDLVWARPVE